MQLKHKLKRFTAITLSCLSVVSTPLTAYAVGGNTGANDNEGIHGGYGSDMGANRPNSRLGFLEEGDNNNEEESINNFISSINNL